MRSHWSGALERDALRRHHLDRHASPRRHIFVNGIASSLIIRLARLESVLQPCLEDVREGETLCLMIAGKKLPFFFQKRYVLCVSQFLRSTPERTGYLMADNGLPHDDGDDFDNLLTNDGGKPILGFAADDFLDALDHYGLHQHRQTQP